MSYQPFRGQFLIPSQSSTSNEISGSVIDPFEEITLFAPSNTIGSLRLVAKLDQSTTWHQVMIPAGTAGFVSASVAANTCLMIPTIAADSFKLTGSANQNGVTASMLGAYDVSVKGLP